jgi:hypothetical protein
MANIVAQEDPHTVQHFMMTIQQIPVESGPPGHKVPILTPGGSFAAGGLTTGQIFPAGLK